MDAPVHADLSGRKTLRDVLEAAAGAASQRGVRFVSPQGLSPLLGYRALLQAAEAVATQLAGESLRSGQFAFLLFGNPEEFLKVFWGCVLAGVVPVPLALAPSYRSRNSVLERMIASWRLVPDAPVLCGAEDAAHIREASDLYAATPPRVLVIRPGGKGGGGYVRCPLDADAPVVMMLTSGSTGGPKGVLLSHRNVIARSEGTSRVNGFTSTDVSFNWFPFDHVGGLVMFHVLDVYLQSSQIHALTNSVLEDPLRWFDWCSAHGVTITWAPNFAFSLINARSADVAARQWDLSRLRFIMNAGEAVVPGTMRRFLEIMEPHGLPPESVVPAWGMSETCSAVFYNRSFSRRCIADTDTSVSVGEPLPGTEARIVDEDGNPLPECRTGHLQVRGPTRFLAYYAAPDLTRAAFVGDGWFRTGDEAMIENGRITITGRKKDEIVVRGVNYASHEIEAAADAVPGVRPSFSAACQVIDPGTGSEDFAVFFAPAEPDPAIAARLSGKVRMAVLGRVGIMPRFVFAVAPEQIPKTSIGKIQRSALRQRFEKGEFKEAVDLASIAADVDTGDPVLNRVRSIWAEVLGVGNVAPDANLFALGGDSLRAAGIVARLRSEFKAGVQLAHVFDGPTPAELAAVIRQLQAVPASGTGELGIVSQPRRDGPNDFPMSPAQERIWFLERLMPGIPAYIELLRFDFTTAPDPERLLQSFRAMVARHEILRTTFLLRHGNPVQCVQPSMDFEFIVRDLSAHDENSAEQLLEEDAQRLSHLPFDLERGPCFRCRLMVFSSGRASLLLVIHHLLVDSWSLGVLMKEMLDGYDPSIGRIPLSLQYADFACWQKAFLDTDAYRAQEAYWRAKLEGMDSVMELPGDKPRPARQTFNGRRTYLKLSAELLERVRKTGAPESASPFMVMLAAFNVLLYRYTRRRDVAVGMPVLNHNDPATDPLIGLFANTVVVRVPVDPAEPFSAYVRRVRTAVLEAVANQNVPFERVIERLGIERDPSRSPLVQILFQSINYPVAMGSSPRVAYRECDNHTAKFDLTLQVAETEGGLTCMCEYNTDLFLPETVERLLHHYEYLVAQACGNAGDPVRTLGLMDAAGRRVHLAAGQGPVSGWRPRQCVHEVFEAVAAQRADHVAVYSEDGNLTYRELNVQADRLAARLRAAGLGRGDVVALFLERRARMLVAMLAAVKSGAAYLPVDPVYPDDRVRFMLEDSNCAVVLTEAVLAGRLPSASARIHVDEEAPQDAAGMPVGGKQADRGASNPEDLLYIIYTSGSTGRPKGVCVRHRNVVHLVQTASMVIRLEASDTWSIFHSYAFDFSTWEIWCPLLTGGSAAIVPFEATQSPRRLVKLLHRFGVTVLNLTPSALGLLMDEFADGLVKKGVHLRQLIVGGEAFSSDLGQRVLRWGVPVYNFYGPTECTVWASAQRLGEPAFGGRYVPIGRPLPDTQLLVLDDDGQPVPAALTGELCIGGAGVAAGYHDRPELTAAHFVANKFSTDVDSRIYRTGDLVRQRPDGAFEFLGRADSQVKFRGYRIELGEVEAALRECPGVRQCAVAIMAGPAGQEILAGYVVGDASESDCRSRLVSRLPAYMVPQQLMFLPALPLNAHGKVDRAALPPLRAAADQVAMPGADDDVLAELASMWKQVLGVKRVNPDDDFFDRGGTSLLAVSLFARIRERWDRDLPLAVLFEAPTLGKLAAAVREYTWAPDSPALVPIQTQGRRPPWFCVHGGGGHVLVYRDLVRRLGVDQPFYGLQLPELASHAEPLSSMKTVARVYLREVRAVQPKGPYYLGGVSYGGVIAYEMARQLIAENETVALLVMFDTYAPGYPRYPARRHRIREALLAACFSMEHHIRGLLWLDPAARWRYLGAFMQRTARRSFYPFEDVWRFFKRGCFRLTGRALSLASYEAMEEALKTYTLESYPGRLLLFRANRQPPGALPDPTLGWGPHVQGGIDVVETPGYHADIISEPRLRFMIDELRTRLAAAQVAALSPKM